MRAAAKRAPVHDRDIEDEAFLRREALAVVTGSRLVGDLPAVVRHDILRFGVLAQYAAGERIAEQGRLSPGWMCCCQGNVRISKLLKSQKRITLDYLQSGEWFGHSSLLSGQPQVFGIHAHDASTVFIVQPDDLTKLLAEHSDLSLAMLRMSAKRSVILHRQLEAFRTQTLRSRLARELVRLAKGFGDAGGRKNDQALIALRLSQDELAQLVGSSRQRVNFELKQFERDQVIACDTRSIMVRPKRLEELAGTLN